MNETNSSSVYYDSNINAAVGTFIGYFSLEKFITMANDLLKILETKIINKQLNDFSEMKILNPEIQIWLNTKWFPKVQLFGLKYFAFVIPEDFLGKQSMEQANAYASETLGIEIQYFTSIYDAKSWLTDKY